MNRNWTFVGAVFGGLAVAAGAFGAHALRDRLSAEAVDWWRTAAQYHLAHALALLVVGFAVPGDRSKATAVAGWSFASGIVLFSGSLYALALTGAHWLGAITPFGGGLFVAGWVALARSALRRG